MAIELACDLYAVQLVRETCCQCGTAFAMTKDFYEACRRDSAKTFHCPNGHRQYYSRTREQELREQLEAARREAARQREFREAAERQRRAQFAQATRARNERDRLKARIAAGVCPCCGRSFTNLRRHMQGVHPEWKAGRE